MAYVPNTVSNILLLSVCICWNSKYYYMDISEQPQIPAEKPDYAKYYIPVIISILSSIVCIYIYSQFAGSDATIGMIMMWYPPAATITSLTLAASYVPNGWAICDGTKGTPDLRGRFVLMAADKPAPVAGGAVHPVRQIGGEETHVLSGGEMPSHSHVTAPEAGYPNGCLGYGNKAYSGGGGADFGGGSGGSCYRTSGEGGNQPHNTMPPFYTLIYIMHV